jgi:hypothetical protein
MEKIRIDLGTMSNVEPQSHTYLNTVPDSAEFREAWAIDFPIEKFSPRRRVSKWGFLNSDGFNQEMEISFCFQQISIFNRLELWLLEHSAHIA